MVALPASYNVKSQVNSIAQAPPTQEEHERKRQADKAWDAYKGKLPDPLKVEKNQPNDNVKANRCEPIVNKIGSALFGQVVKIEAPDETPTSDTKIQAFIDGLWGDDDDRMTKLNKIAVNGGCFGEPFLKLIPAQGPMKYPRIVNLDPRLMRIVTDPEDCDLHVAYIIEYPGPADWQKKQIISRVDPDNSAPTAGDYDIDDTWTISNYVRMGTLGTWYKTGEPIDWPYPFAPIFCCQNLPNPNEAWGTPDLNPVIVGLNESINFLLSSLARIAKFHGHPKTWASGIHASQIATAIDDIICLPSPESKLGKLDAMTDFAGLLALICDLRGSMDEQSRVPAVAQGRQENLPTGTISGIALKLMFQPLIDIATQKQRLYGSLIRCITRAALVLADIIPVEQYEDYPIEMRWPALLPSDALQDAQGAIALQTAGVSRSTALQEINYDAEYEAKQKAKEDADAAKLQPTPVQSSTSPEDSARPDQQQEVAA